MPHHIAVCGLAAPDGLYARCGDGWRKLQPTRTPLVAQVTPCEVCGGDRCDCITPQAQAAMLARISADPHDYNNLTNLDLPY